MCERLLRTCPTGDSPEFDVIALPHAGGNHVGQRALAQALGPRFRVTAVQYPGRLDRIREDPLEDLTSIADEIHRCWEPTNTRRVVIGTSMGALLAFELVRRLEASGRAVDLMVVSGCQPPHGLRPRPPGLAEQLDRHGMEALVALTGLNREILDYPEVVDLLLPVLKAEISAVEQYAPPPEARVKCPVLAVVGSDDPLVPQGVMGEWSLMTEGSCEEIILAGGHLLCETEPQALADSVLARLRETRSPGEKR